MNTVNNTINTSRFKRIDLEQAFLEKPPPLDFVLPGMLVGTVGALVAQGGIGKSWLALELVRFLKVFLGISATVTLLGCATTGEKLDSQNLEFERYTQSHRMYIYRKSQFVGSLATSTIEVNNETVGDLGMGQVLEADLVKGINIIASFANLNQRSYNLLLKINSPEPRYIILSYDHVSFLKEVSFKQWQDVILSNMPLINN